MASTVKESDRQNPSAPVSSAGTAQPRVQPVALEISVTVNGARTVEGSDKREPFSETTQTVLVFGNGAVIRLNSGVTPGQLLFLTNEKTKKEVVCQVVKSKNYRSMSGYVELEFTEPAVGFWGMRFPSDRVAPVLATTGTASSPAVPVKPVLPRTEKVPAPGVTTVPPPSAVAVPSAPVVAAPVNRTPVLETNAGGLASVVSEAATIVTATADGSTEELKKQTARLQEQLSSMMFDETPAPPPKPDRPILQLDAIAMSEATAKIFELATPESAATAASSESAAASSARQAGPLSPAPVARSEKAASLLQEEVKIPSWLEPLARNAGTSTQVTEAPLTAPPPAAPPLATSVATPFASPVAPAAAPPVRAAVAPPLETPAMLEVTELEDPQVEGESYNFGAKEEAEFVPIKSIEAPSFGSSLLESSGAPATEAASGGSKKGLWIGAIAATLLLAAGGGAWWYMLQQGHASASRTTAASQPATQLGSQPEIEQHLAATPASASEKGSSAPSLVSSEPPAKPAPELSPASDVQKIAASGRDSLKPAPASAASHAAEPVSRPVEGTRSPTFTKMRLAAPTVKGRKPQTASSEAEPGITMESGANPASGALSSGLGGSKSSQPAVPIPIGGDVTSLQLISSVPPVYPQLARTQRVSGEVKVDALIDENGRVTGTKVVSGPVMLHQAAVDALRQWKYKPATLNGKPVSMHVVVTIQFRLQ